MSTFNNTVQTLLAKINNNQAGTGSTPLTAEETMLLTKAVGDLANHADFELALLAVANGHLDNASGDLDDAKATLLQAVSDNLQSMQAAETSLLSKSEQLDIAASVPVALANYIPTKDGTIGNLEDLLMRVLGGKAMASADYGSLIPPVHSIFCSDGEVRLYVCPTTHGAGTSGDYNMYHNFLSKAAGVDAKTGAFSRHSYCFHSYNSARTNWAHLYGNYPCMGEFPLADVGQTTIVFKQLISDYISVTESADSYRGIGLFNDSAYQTITGHFNNIEVTDRYGRTTGSFSNGFHSTSSYSITALYDNVKNCIVCIHNGKVWELYSDGWHDPAIATFGDETQAQAWVDAHEDIFIVYLWNMGSSNSFEPYQREQTIEDQLSNISDSYNAVSGRFSAMVVGSATDTVTFNAPSDGMPAMYRNNRTPRGVDINNGSGIHSSDITSTQYLWDTEARKLTPLFTEEVVEIVPSQSVQQGTSAAQQPWGLLKRSVKVWNLETKELIKSATMNCLSKNGGNYQGSRGSDLLAYNPYDDTWYETFNTYQAGTYSTCIRRLQNGQDYIDELNGGRVNRG